MVQVISVRDGEARYSCCSDVMQDTDCNVVQMTTVDDDVGCK